MAQIKDNNAFLMARGPGSRIEIHAADARKVSWTQLEGSTDAGDVAITVGDDTSWQIGDKIAIAATGYALEAAEKRTIVQVGKDGKTLTLDRPLDYNHFGEIESHDADNMTREIDMRAEVALLSRNVTIRGDAGSLKDGYGAHSMVMMGAEMRLDGVEMTRMGQAGDLGRYPVHWHLLGDASGQYITNSSIHHTYNKGLTIHGTQNLWVQGNAIVDTVGHSYYFEDGSEFGNVLVGNLGMNTRATESVASGPIGSDHTAVSTYWVTNPDNHLVGNHAAGSDVAGFWFLSQEEVEGRSADMPRYAGYVPNDQTPGLWADNSSHTNGEDGIFIGGQFDETTGLRSSFDPHLHKLFGVDGFTTYKNLGFGIWVRNADGEWSDIAIADSKKAVRMWGSNEIDGGVIVGRSGNFEKYGFDSHHGWELYDMASVLKDVHFAGFDGALDTAIANHSGWGRNTNNAVSGLTFGGDVEKVFATRSHTSFLDGLIDEDGALMGGLHDVDGSLTGQPGAVLTPGIIDTRPGRAADVLSRAFDNIPAAGFNWTQGAKWVETGNYWLNPAGSVIGRQTFFTSPEATERSDFTIRRSDNGASLYYGRTTQGDNSTAQLNVDGAMSGEYIVTYPHRLPPAGLDLAIWDLPFGTEVTYRFVGLPLETRIWGADKVTGRKALDANEGSAWTRLGNGDVIVKLVADRFSDRIYDATEELPEASAQVYHDYLGFYFDPGPGEVNTPNLPPYAAPDDFRAEFVPPDLPDRVTGASDTIADTDQLAHWSMGSTWDARAPGPGDVVVIDAGQRVVLDADARVEGIIISGQGSALIIKDAPETAINLIADWVLVQNGGLLQAGTETDPLDTDFQLTLTGDDPDFDLDVDAYLKGAKPDAVFAADTGGTVIGEASSVSTNQAGPNKWHTVSFTAPIADAVVVMGPVESNGGQPAVTRVRNVTENGFQFQIDEWDYLDGIHVTETIGWIAVTEGAHQLSGGQSLVAGETQIGTAFEPVDFGTTLTDAVVLTEVTSDVGKSAVTTRIRDVGDDGFDVRLSEAEGADGLHPDETVSWIAIESGISADVAARRTADVVTHMESTFALERAFPDNFVLIADMQTSDGLNTAALRYNAVTPNSAALRIEEEQSADAEAWHTTEVAGILALEDGFLFGA